MFTIGSGCLNYLGTLNDRGYPKTKKDKKQYFVHRLVWEYFNDKTIPAGLVIRHSCDNPSCINPLHLICGTQKENIQDQLDRGRHALASKTYCPRGHKYAGDNLYLNPKTGHRQCKKCKAINRKRFYDAKGC